VLVRPGRETGEPRPKPHGGDRHSHRNEAHAPFILECIEDKSDITLVEIQVLLADIGVSVRGLDPFVFFPSAADHIQRHSAYAAKEFHNLNRSIVDQ
jgi:hypothetical protein